MACGLTVNQSSVPTILKEEWSTGVTLHNLPAPPWLLGMAVSLGTQDLLGVPLASTFPAPSLTQSLVSQLGLPARGTAGHSAT